MQSFWGFCKNQDKGFLYRERVEFLAKSGVPQRDSGSKDVVHKGLWRPTFFHQPKLFSVECFERSN